MPLLINLTRSGLLIVMLTSMIGNEAKSNLFNFDNYSDYEVIKQNHIELPIEILGQEGTIVSRSLNLTSEQATRVKRLWIQANNLSYNNKGAVRINNGSWYDLNNSSVDMHVQEKSAGGMEKGGYGTIRFSIPASDFNEGSNQIDFKFNTSDGISIGYRVIRFNLLDEYKNKLLPESDFVQEEPNDWKAPLKDQQAINEGKDLWTNAQLWNHYLPNGREGFWFDYKIPARKQIKAKCAQCHLQDGRDLEMFSYSNKSIIERSKFHGLSEEDGQKIASYIRSLSEEYDNVGRYGRPWNPPYQPGEELKDKPIDQWYAGAGIDAVLESDSEMIPYLFPNGFTKQNVVDFLRAKYDMDYTEIPVAMQFPDWKNWLPIIHPADAYGEVWDRTDMRRNPKNALENYRNFLETTNLTTVSESDLSEAMADFHWTFRRFHDQFVSGNPHWRTKGGDAYDKANNEVFGPELAKTSLARLVGVKHFEAFNEFNLQGKAYEFYQNSPAKPLTKSWLGTTYHVFEIPPHFTSCEIDGNCSHFKGQSRKAGIYESAAWYELQFVIGNGRGQTGGNHPVDWQYQFAFLLSSGSESGLNQNMRYLRAIQALHYIKGGFNDPNRGFRMRQQGVSYIYGMSPENSFAGYLPGEFVGKFREFHEELPVWFVEGMLERFLDEVERFDLSSWNRTQYGSDHAINQRDFNEPYRNPEKFIAGQFNYTEDYYYLIGKFADLGVDCNVLMRFKDWCKEAWPYYNPKNLSGNQPDDGRGWDDLLKEKGDILLNLYFEEGLACKSNVIAAAYSAGEKPAFQWTINGVDIDETSNILSSNDYKLGDYITCTVSGSNKCKGQVTQTATIISPKLEIGVTHQNSILENEAALIETLGNNATVDVSLNIDPIIWLDAYEINSDQEPKDGEEIDRWYNKVDNSRQVNVSTGNRRPHYDKDGFHGKPAMIFGSKEGVRATGMNLIPMGEDDFLNDDWTIIVVGEGLGDTGNWKDVVGNRTEGNQGFIFRFSGSGKSQIAAARKYSSGKNRKGLFNFITTLTKKDLSFNAYINGEIEIKLDVGSDDLFTRDNTPVYLGQGENGDSHRYHKGAIAEVLVFDRALTKEEREVFEGYLFHKWEMQNDIATVHSFKNNSPVHTVMNTPSGETIELTLGQNMIPITSYGDYIISNNNCDNSIFTFRSLEDIPVDVDIQVYPNPVKDILTIVGLNEEITLEVVDILGKTVFEVESFSNEIEHQVSFGHLSSAVYFLRFRENGSLKKIIPIIKK